MKGIPANRDPGRERSELSVRTGASAPEAGYDPEPGASAPEAASYDPEQYEREKADGTRKVNGAVRLRELSGKHLRAINLHLAGAKGREIARELEMTEGWVSVVLNDPLAQAEIRQRFVDTDNELFAKATDVIDRSMNSMDEAIALRGAEMVWRSRGKFEKREPVRTTAEDVVQRMLELAAATGDASVTIRATAGESLRDSESVGNPTGVSQSVWPDGHEPEPRSGSIDPDLKPWHRAQAPEEESPGRERSEQAR